jgi:hypothetical protein
MPPPLSAGAFGVPGGSFAGGISPCNGFRGRAAVRSCRGQRSADTGGRDCHAMPHRRDGVRRVGRFRGGGAGAAGSGGAARGHRLLRGGRAAGAAAGRGRAAARCRPGWAAGGAGVDGAAAPGGTGGSASRTPATRCTAAAADDEHRSTGAGTWCSSGAAASAAQPRQGRAYRRRVPQVSAPRETTPRGVRRLSIPLGESRCCLAG